jgi:putative tryptophan/tyrosine transport system substrate-binding protein
MRRRAFIAGLGGAVAWLAVARAQQDHMRRVGVLMGFDENDPVAKAYLSAFTQALAALGWTDGRNVRMHLRLTGSDISRVRAFAHELVGLQPDIILTFATQATADVQQETPTIPIVFVNVSDPVASGLVASLDRPGGNITGFATFEPSLGSKWLELLSEIAPGLKRAAIMFNPDTAPPGPIATPISLHMPSFEAAARSLNVEPITAPVRSDAEIETAINALGHEPRGGVVVFLDIFTAVHRAPIMLATARNNVPAVYGASESVREGGLLSYGPAQIDSFPRAASYVDRILRGAKPAELPVQLPVKFEMAVNLRTAKALGLTVPLSILARADEVIE